MLTYNKLHAGKLVDKIEFLSCRIEERFPDSGLSKVCIELHGIASESEQVCRWISKPHKWIRFFVAVVIILILVTLVMTLISLKIPQDSFALTEFVDVFEAALSAVVLIGAALVFLITVETRIKRIRTLKSINELRAIAHVIDIHQLTKDPARISPDRAPTTSSPQKTRTAYELTRYLSYCSELLSLVGKVTALYGQNFNDAVVLTAVNDVEILATSLSRKIWQKVQIIYSMKPVQ